METVPPSWLEIKGNVTFRNGASAPRLPQPITLSANYVCIIIRHYAVMPPGLFSLNDTKLFRPYGAFSCWVQWRHAKKWDCIYVQWNTETLFTINEVIKVLNDEEAAHPIRTIFYHIDYPMPRSLGVIIRKLSTMAKLQE